MTNLSDYFDKGNFYDTSDANIVVGDLAVGKIGYGSTGRLEGVYDPGMMAFDGASGYYDKTYTSAGNLLTAVVRFTAPSVSGGSAHWVMASTGPSSNARLSLQIPDNDFATAASRGKLEVVVKNSAGANVCKLGSSTTVTDGAEYVVFFAYDGDNGTSLFYINGADEDDVGYTGRVLTTGTLYTGASSTLYVGALPSVYLAATVGYCGMRDAYLTNPTDFYHPTNGLQELDESGWTEWGAQPLFWNQYGTMSDNKGSGGNMTANGTITGPA